MLANLICIGASKCGTTSLHRYLDLHPEIQMAADKELNFFSGPGWNWDHGLKWYEAKLPQSGRLRGESSHTYSIDPFVAGVPERIASVIPDVKLLYIVGDPVERIVSDWVGNRATGREQRPLEDLCLDSRLLFDTWYFNRSRYYHQLSRYLEVFPRKSIHVLTKEDLALRRRETLIEVFRFLGVAEDFDDEQLDQVHNPSAPKRVARPYMTRLRQVPGIERTEAVANRARGPLGRMAQFPFSRLIKRPKLSDEARERLAEALAPDVAALRSLMGSQFGEWSL